MINEEDEKTLISSQAAVILINESCCISCRDKKCKKPKVINDCEISKQKKEFATQISSIYFKKFSH